MNHKYSPGPQTHIQTEVSPVYREEKCAECDFKAPGVRSCRAVAGSGHGCLLLDPQPAASSGPNQLGAAARPSARRAVQSAAWPRHLAPNPNWNPERAAIQAGWPGAEEGWPRLSSVCSPLQKKKKPVDCSHRAAVTWGRPVICSNEEIGGDLNLHTNLPRPQSAGARFQCKLPCVFWFRQTGTDNINLV